MMKPGDRRKLRKATAKLNGWTKKRAAILNVHLDFLADVLGLPQDIEIVGFQGDWERNPEVLRLKLYGGDLPFVEEGAIIPTVQGAYSEDSREMRLTL